MDNDSFVSPYFSVQQNFKNLSVQYPPVGRARQNYYSETGSARPRRNSAGGDLSDHISKLIAENASIVGNQNAKSSSKPSDRKRVTKGPWRYDERIQQLGYQPNSSGPSRSQASKVRRNSLPVQPIGFTRDILSE
ncbi:Oidioi.mRNA.OKI2018_I69.chr1.g1909.t2.cds [Oikopleura dioica]|uniref:Oidioi.mRNA.OKI2018_I69.chr1.g1909.t2.cds n=1 Tax=Oikopleura dioica TaxID=34765 RepID=A0ABN7SSW3_OIKDI|nr:Oidioi.mRNA.OKI2018_I69.chr1.g1909.t2.cds [Oikopleura dioica]